MKHEAVLHPPVLSGDAEARVDQLRKYLFMLTEQLQNLFDAIGAETGVQTALQNLDKRIARLEDTMRVKAKRASLNGVGIAVEEELEKLRKDVDEIKELLADKEATE